VAGLRQRPRLHYRPLVRSGNTLPGAHRIVLMGPSAVERFPETDGRAAGQLRLRRDIYDKIVLPASALGDSHPLATGGTQEEEEQEQSRPAAPGLPFLL
jgi:hypothetical protein